MSSQAQSNIGNYIGAIAGSAAAGYMLYQLPVSSSSSLLAGGGFLVSQMYIAPLFLREVGAANKWVEPMVNITVAGAAAQYLGGDGLGMQEGMLLGVGAYVGQLVYALVLADRGGTSY